ncbi:hypothetical protein QBC32DRAFT_146261 [Pseudoneurospora amorphoporcata]|uniref:NodB homology domain-containing protein n=1 Tax=Pseudoneurospora amorphoporcata TaxID=241081 RepID=A0AAN6NUD2_9PEZI|nr:hypothetical protein QBC32DRAFT_146261 [Pseudoneurospora amorphoporcata]
MRLSKFLPVGVLVAPGRALPAPSKRVPTRNYSPDNYGPNNNNYGPDYYYPNDNYPNQDTSSSSSVPYQDSSSSSSYQNDGSYLPPTNTTSSASSPGSDPSPLYLPRAVPTGLIINSCTVPGIVALTFDDGPYIYTSALLDTLASFSPPVHATFFINGANWVSGIDDESTPYPSLLRRMLSSGHQIASHTWSHLDLTSASTAQRVEQVTLLEDTLQRVVGVRPRYIRPPYATCENGCLEDLEGMGYHVVNFDLDTKDYANDSPQGIQTSVDKFNGELGRDVSTDSAIVLSHDVHQWTVERLAEEMVKTVRERGFRTGTVGECLGDPQSGWYA